jgi:hypothetical protein
MRLRKVRFRHGARCDREERYTSKSCYATAHIDQLTDEKHIYVGYIEHVMGQPGQQLEPAN